MLQLQEISKTYKLKNGLEVRALQKVSVTFQEKGLVFILGKSGSGKSTMLNVIGGLDQVDEGEIIIKGKSSKTFKDGDFDNYRNTFIGFVFQEYNLIEDFTLGKNIALALELQGHKATPELVHNILEEVDMVGYENRRVNQISSGQKQRVAIARALIKNPQIILADEPTGALDSGTGKQVLELLKKLSEDKLVIVVSHDIETANIFADRIIELKDGEIISDVTKIKNPTKDLKKGFKQNKNILCLDEDYKLKESDLKLLQKLHDENETLVITKKQELLDTYTFDNTKVDEIDQKTYDGSLLKLIKSKLKNTDSFKIGASGLKHKRFRLFMTILLSFVSLSFFALTDTMSAFDSNEAHMRTLSDNNISSAKIAQTLKGDDELFFSYMYYSFTNEKLNEIKTSLPKASISPIVDENIQLPFIPLLQLSANLTKGNRILWETLGYNPPTETVFIRDDFLTKNNYELLAGHMPSEDHEYLISSFTLETFKRFGFVYYNGEDEVVINPSSFTQDAVNNANLILNKTFDGYRVISGVIDINYDKDLFTEDYLASMENDYEARNKLTRYIEANNLLNFYARETILDLFYYEDKGISDKFYPSNARTIVKQEGYEYLLDFDYLVKENDLKDDLLFKFYDRPLNDDEVIVSANVLMNSYKLATSFYIESNYETTYIPSLHLDASNVKKEFLTINELINWSKTPANAQIVNNLITSVIGEIEINDPLMGTKDFAKYKIAGIYFPTSSIVGDDYYFEAYSSYSILSVSPSKQAENFPISFVKVLLVNNNDQNLFNTYNKILDFEDDIFKLNIISEFSDIFLTFGTLFEILSSVFLVLGIILAVFSSLLMMNFIGLSIAFKKREIGILRGLGASKGDVVKIFGFESLIIAVINIVLAIVVCAPAIFAINQKVAFELGIQITFLAFTFRQIILIIAIALVSAAIASIIPVLRIARKKPIDAIYDR